MTDNVNTMENEVFDKFFKTLGIFLNETGKKLLGYKWKKNLGRPLVIVRKFGSAAVSKHPTAVSSSTPDAIKKFFKGATVFMWENSCR